MTTPPLRARSRVAASVFGTVLAYWLVVAQRTGSSSDFDQLWVAARMLREGVNPYLAIHPGTPVPGAHALGFPFYYPLPAALVALPVSGLPIAMARALFCAAGFGLLAFAITRRSWTPLIALLSGAALSNLALAQWGVVAALAVVWPQWGALTSVKPNALLAVGGGWRWDQRRAIVVGMAIGALLWASSFALQPDWLSHWLSAVKDQPHFEPVILRPFGFLVLLALPLYRQPAARWMLVTTLLPGTPAAYAVLPLLVFQWARKELLTLALLTHIAMWIGLVIAAKRGDNVVSGAAVTSSALLWVLYLPAIAMLWRRRAQPGIGPLEHRSRNRGIDLDNPLPDPPNR